jgi:CheY-like chemotaxis protein
VVEDEPDLRSYLVETLQDLNYRVREAPDGASALALFDSDSSEVDLLLTDIVMPGINGRQLADELCNRQPSLKVLFMTGYSRDAIVHHGRLDVGVSMLQKPLTQATLAAKIRHILDLPRTALKAG